MPTDDDYTLPDHLEIRPLTEYQFEKRVDQRAERHALEEECKPGFRCELCNKRSDVECMTPTELIGDYSTRKRRTDGNPVRIQRVQFKTKFLITCQPCHILLTGKVL